MTFHSHLHKKGRAFGLILKVGVSGTRKWLIVTLVIYFNVINSLRFIPESARWLLVKNKSEQARKELEKVAAFNRKEMPDEELEQKGANEAQRTGDFRDLFNSFNMTKRTLISCFSW